LSSDLQKFSQFSIKIFFNKKLARVARPLFSIENLAGRDFLVQNLASVTPLIEDSLSGMKFVRP
jgi:hypothetical protein